MVPTFWAETRNFVMKLANGFNSKFIPTCSKGKSSRNLIHQVHRITVERQIAAIRKILAGVCGEQSLTGKSLLTLMCEVESIINNLLLTTVSNDCKDLNSITPNHRSLLKEEVPLLPGLFTKTMEANLVLDQFVLV